MSFQFHALDHQQFSHLFEMSDAELHEIGATRSVVDAYPGTPCRVSLEDAPLGETVILVNYEHMAKQTPFRATHAVYVRPDVTSAQPEINAVPALLRHRILSVRAFDASGMMKDADVVEGKEVEKTIMRLFEDPDIEELHVHYAKPGCFAARVSRA